MSKYKQIKSVAHNFSHSFTSLMNWEDREYVMDRLTAVMFKHKIDEITLDILSAHLEPVVTNTSEIVISVDRYCNYFFPELLESHGLSMRYIKAANMTLSFQFPDMKIFNQSQSTLYVPFQCRTTILDDKSRTHVGEVMGEDPTNALAFAFSKQWIY